MFEKFTDKAREVFLLESGIHIAGNREVAVENCTRIEEYSEVLVQMISGGLRVQIWGSRLRVSDYKTQGVLIRGKISRVELEERRAKRRERPDKRLR